MSICGIIKESPRPVLLCHAEMKWCQQVSAAAQLVTQQSAEQTESAGRAAAPRRAAPSAKLRRGNTEVQMGDWVLSTTYQPMSPLPPALTDISSAKSARVCVCQEEIFA